MFRVRLWKDRSSCAGQSARHWCPKYWYRSRAFANHVCCYGGVAIGRTQGELSTLVGATRCLLKQTCVEFNNYLPMSTTIIRDITAFAGIRRLNRNHSKHLSGKCWLVTTHLQLFQRANADYPRNCASFYPPENEMPARNFIKNIAANYVPHAVIV